MIRKANQENYQPIQVFELPEVRAKKISMVTKHQYFFAKTRLSCDPIPTKHYLAQTKAKVKQEQIIIADFVNDYCEAANSVSSGEE